MKREIKFRALTLLTREWVYGDLIHLDDYTLIAGVDMFAGEFKDCSIELEAILIDPETVGQFTGLNDKNGMDIYEGDILISGNGSKQEIQFGEFLYMDESHIGFYFYPEMTSFGLSYSGDTDCYEIIGNIHENPPKSLEVS